jgi:hypothetical protein
LTLSSKIQTCFLWYFGMHNLCNKFWLSSPKTSHPISILLKIWHSELQSSYHLLIYFLIMFILSHMFCKFIFLSWIPSSCYLFILAFSFFCSLVKIPVNHFLIFSKCYGKWSS